MRNPPCTKTTTIIAAATLVWFACPNAARAQQDPPDGFEVVPYADGLLEPVSLAFMPDGRLLVTEKSGTVRVVVDGQLQPEPLATVDVYTVNENGLVGVAVDPDFEHNHYVYVFASISNQQQNIIRFTERGGIGTERYVIRENLPGTESVHAGGGLHFGPDGMLYFSIGDTGNKNLAQDLRSLAGKICRIRPDGTTPPDNPFKTPTGSPRAIYALGFRNPFRFTFAPDGRLFVMDVGSDDGQRREEINIIRAGDNAGWPLVEGQQLAPLFPTFVDPIVAYHDQGQAITGAAFYTGAQFPPEYRGNLFHLDFVLNRVFRLVLDGDKPVRDELFYEGSETGPVDLVQAPDGALMFSEIFTGRIMQIRYTRSIEPAPADAPAGTNDGETGSDVAGGNSDVSDPNAPPLVDALPGLPLCGASLTGGMLTALLALILVRIAP